MRTVIALLAVVVLVGAAAADDWPCFRGPTHDGKSAETDWSPRALSAGKILWRAEVGKGHSSFAVVADRAYTMGNSDNQDSVFCFDGKTGKVIWKESYPCRSGNYPGPRGTPTVDGGFVYVINREGHLRCLDAKTGEVKWLAKAKTEVPRWGIATSPLIHGDLVVVNTGDSGAAYHKKTGKLKWMAGDGMPGYASPVFAKFGSSETFLIFSKDSLICVGAKSGRPRWSFPWKVRYDVNAADPVLVGRSGVFISSGYGKGCAMLKASSRGVSTVWQNTGMRAHMATPIHHEGYLYGFDDKLLACLDAKTGRTMWSQAGPNKGALILANDMLIFVTEFGIDLVVAKATPKGYEEIARAPVLPGDTWTSPVLSNGRVYVRNKKGAIACVDLTGK